MEFYEYGSSAIPIIELLSNSLLKSKGSERYWYDRKTRCNTGSAHEGPCEADKDSSSCVTRGSLTCSLSERAQDLGLGALHNAA